AMNGLLGAFVSAVSAILLRQNRSDGISLSAMPSGLYGYNGVVIGIMMAAFSAEGNFCWWLSLPNVFMCLLCLLVSSALSSVANRWGLIIFTLPFNIFGLSTHCSNGSQSPLLYFPKLFLSAPVGVGQVHGYDSPWTGSLILLALLLSSPTICFHAMLGSAAGMLSGTFTQACGGYNSALSLIAVGGVFCVIARENPHAVPDICLSYHVSRSVLPWHPLSAWFATCPFCLSALIFLLISSEIPAICRLSQSVVSYPEENQR
uniref:Urea transporter n=1 Tax=Echeneis naucrates TaxID=173247 RepID=A0A665W2B6_ECHNA